MLPISWLRLHIVSLIDEKMRGKKSMEQPLAYSNVCKKLFPQEEQSYNADKTTILKDLLHT